MSDPKIARCWDKDWKYVPKDATDVAATFRRIRKAMKDQAAADKALEAENVKPIRKRSAQ